ncbi:unnamed protein product [Microthlaspi erraticum]|uniref:F-box domain-containing protein n=1 Tax=Microthlaspi erraticum TaxID=1685480 RepID=A0A6D2K1F1_9BRAS|nr:unnamed protein product [Microthlaspi erraticum]
MKLCNLPSEIEEEILSRVPIKSLRQLRATSKGWYHHPLFKDPRFIKRYSAKAPPRKYHKAIVLNEFRIQSMSSYIDHRRISPSRFLLIDPVSNEKMDPAEGEGMSSYRSYALGYDNKELCRSYKILRSIEDQTMEIYEFKSDSWRNLDGVSPGGSFESLGVSLKGNAYGSREEEEPKNCLGPYVLKEGLNNLALSVVKEDRLCLFYESATKSKTEIWMSSEIGETESVYWSRYLAVESTPFYTRHVSFYIDEEEKLATCFYNHERHMECLAKVKVFGDVATRKGFPGMAGYKSFGWHDRTACGPIVFGYLPRFD